MELEEEKRAQKQLLQKLQEVDFVLVELNLYLDTHPWDSQALDQYNYYVKKREKIKCIYEQKYGPLTNFGHSYNQYPKGWDEGPWPWEI